IINMVSFFSYQYFLFGPETVPMPVLALVMLLIVAIQTRHLLLRLYACDAEPPPADLPPAPP
ncbi:MAG TPA: hypothetical protein VMJ64_02045, partial [Anaerolineales bacterium]|nr:hypothetical protein [Anaerolineales bacterium]